MATTFNWKPEDKFEISGQELDILHNSLHTLFNTNVPDPQKHVFLSEAFKVTSAVVQRGLKDGTIVEKEVKSEMEDTPVSEGV